MNKWFLHGAKKGYTVLFRYLKVRWIVQESPIYHHIAESLLYQNPMPVTLEKISFTATHFLNY